LAIIWKYPAILTDDEVVGEQATSVFADAQEMLGVILKERNYSRAWSADQVNVSRLAKPPPPS
jgi:5-methyltetrahydrofolate--homocysteine methyltransferase